MHIFTYHLKRFPHLFLSFFSLVRIYSVERVGMDDLSYKWLRSLYIVLCAASENAGGTDGYFVVEA